MTPTKLDVFHLQFDINTPAFLKEAHECSRDGMYSICWQIFRNILSMVAERATELNDPIMNVLMLRLGLYDVNPEDRAKYIKMIEKEMTNDKKKIRD